MSIPYSGNTELLDLNIAVYERAIREWDGCGCQLESMKARLAELLLAKESK